MRQRYCRSADTRMRMQNALLLFDLRSKPIRFSRECSLGIKVHACDPNKAQLLAVALMNN